MRARLAALALTLAGPACADEMTFQWVGNGGNCFGCEWVTATGEITANTPAAFRAFADATGGPASLAFDSPGGDANAAMALGRAMREMGWGARRRGTLLSDDTSYETSICLSECVLAFIGGTERGIDPRFGLTVEGGDDWLAPDRLRYVLDMGASPELLLRAADLAPGTRHVLTEDELTGWAVTNDAATTDPWHLEPYGAGLVLATTQRRGPDYALPITLFCRAKDPRWHVLVAEPGDFSNNGIEADMLAGGTFDSPFDDPDRPIGIEGIEFLRKSGTALTASLRLPGDLVGDGGEVLAFRPDLGRVWGPILGFTVTLPSDDWLEVTRANCI